MDSLSLLDKCLQNDIINIFQKYPNVIPTDTYISTVKTGQLNIRLKTNKVIHYRPYRLAPIEREKVKQIIDDLIQKKIIRESESEFASPVLLVKKKDGNDRLCIDYRALNKNIEKERYPLPLIDDQIDRLGQAKYYISIDMKNGFYQISIAPESIKYTAFITPDGHFEFLKMPFGICNGPSVFQRAISKAVQHLKFILVYIDDLLIPFGTISEGLDYLDQTLKALSDAGFSINLSKCKFFETSIEYLGRTISHEGVKPSQKKVSALVNSPIPANVRQVRQFMGLASYFRRFIPEFSTRTSCITKLVKNDQKWEWGSEQEEARYYILNCLTKEPLLSIFDPNLETELHTDASAIGFGAILFQRHSGLNKVVAYFSKRTSPCESRYHSYELETLSIFNALKHFRVYLLGIHFKVITDCNAIKSTVNKKDLSPRVGRWWTYMQDFSFEVVYRKGQFVNHVDYLSRNPEVDHVLPNTSHALSTVPVPLKTDNALSINLINSPPPRSWLEIAQDGDPETQILIEKARAGDLDFNQYMVRNNLLYYKMDSTAAPKLYIPKGSRLSILRLFHDENCHVGLDKTYQKILEYFWFPGIYKFIKKYISHCLICVEKKTHHGPKQGMLHPIEKTPIPFHTVHLDCTGPFPQSPDGYKHLLIMIDGFTKFCILKPLKTMGAQELVDILRNSLTDFGTPSLIITDRGTNFCSRQLRELFDSWQVRHHMIATGTPRGNGQVERYVSTITNMISTSCTDVSDWPSVLWKVQLSLNTTIQKSTGFSPMRLLLGRTSNIPCIQAQLDEVIHYDENEIIDVTSERQLARQRLINVANKFKERFDQTRRDNTEYSIGDTVYVNQDHRRHDKLKAKFKGPYEIISILENDRFSLRGFGNLRNITVAKEKLRLWPGNWVEDNIV
ncbi:hypothetical protein PYW07_010710 [Mythimna separata]|uniref:RNA-directed DNA polymerase n=1 Tax=Mythimna separata TaxID=271217 RepID=A0AAD8DL41_MYTSE|nr:hypothetical protein PYW07_010710 [Mythimna separata]